MACHSPSLLPPSHLLPLSQVLKYVFGGATDESASFPNIVEVQLCRDIIECICGVEFLFQVLDLPFFKSVHLPEIENWDSSQVTVT